ncbi:MAG TPA: delta-60 repeat domain-containing protein [Solirubrobacterales bacterium]|jgi:uncharacterized delta-60 repeat protein
MTLRGGMRGFHASLLVGLLTLGWIAPRAAADTLAIQPDGKLVLAGRIWPEAGALTRLNADGSVDTGFADNGFSIDRRLPSFGALAIQPDGKIVGAAVGGSVARYLPDGADDQSFGVGGLGGHDEPSTAHTTFSGEGPSDLLVQPDGTIVASGNHDRGGASYEAWVRGYGPQGKSVTPIGAVPQPSKWGGSSSALEALQEEPDGRLIGAGRSYDYEAPNFVNRPLLARFPGPSGLPYDPTFGEGAGLVRPDSAPYEHAAAFSGLARDGDKLLAAGMAADTVLLARFSSDGVADSSFGSGGFAAPPVLGPAANAEGGPRSWAEDVAPTADGGAVIGGGTEQWSTWVPIQRDLSPHCTDCPQPLVARFDSDGSLEPTFGSGGLLHMSRPDGSILVGTVEEVNVLPDGRILVNGSLAGREPFVARLNQNGSYDPSFGDGGLALPQFPCTGEDQAELRRARCTPSALVTLRTRGLRGRHPSVSLTVRPNLDWAAINGLTLTLPRGLRFTRRVARRARAVAIGVPGRHPKLRVYRWHGKKHPNLSLNLSDFGRAREVRLGLPPGTLRPLRRDSRHRGRLRFPITVEFVHAAWGLILAPQHLVRSPGR